MSDEAVNKVTFSVQRTVSVQQYEPIQVFGSMSLGADAPEGTFEALLEVFNKYGEVLATSVVDLAQEQAEKIRGSQPEKNTVARAPRAAAAKPSFQRGRGTDQGEYQDIEGRSIRSYIGDDGELKASAACEHPGCDKRAFFKENTGNNGTTYTALDNVKSAIKYKGGIFCFAHKSSAKPQTSARRPRPQVEEEDDLGF